jgi:hypothetical protein
MEPRRWSRTLVAMMCASAACSGSRAAAADATPATAEAPAGLTVYLDDAGRPTRPGPDRPLVGPPPAASGRAAAPAVETAPGGGRMVRVGGRLTTMMVAHTQADGTAALECLDRGPGGAATPGSLASDPAEELGVR